MLGAPGYLGQWKDIQPLTSEPISQHNIGRPTRGWFMEEIAAMGLNTAAGSKGYKA